MPSLYPIGDLDACTSAGVDLWDLVQQWSALGVSCVQIRAKGASSSEYLELLRRVTRSLPAEVCVYANDRPDLAEMAGCAGVHVGQGDLPVHVVKQAFPRLRVGVSTHDLTQLDSALASRPDYVAFGPVFPTASKRNAEPCVGVEGLRRAWARASEAGIPLVAIGGIDSQNMARVRDLCDQVALIGALTASSRAEVSRRYGELLAAARGIAPQ